jgi:hypothetical protein
MSLDWLASAVELCSRCSVDAQSNQVSARGESVEIALWKIGLSITPSSFLEVALDGFTETLPIDYRLAGIAASGVARLCCHLKVALNNPPPGQESVASYRHLPLAFSELVFAIPLSDK